MNYLEISKIPCTKIKTLPEEEIDAIVDVVIEHYYEVGFPYYEINEAKILKEFESLCDFDVKRLELENNTLQQFMLGLNTANSFHPEMWTTQCKKAKTPMDIFLDRDLFKTALKKRIKYSDTKLVDFNIRKSLKAFGTQAVSNFRPTIAKWVYEKFSPAGGDVLDPCAGYGGRLMGAMCSHVGSYIGVDPNVDAINGNKELQKTIKKIALRKTPNVTLIQSPFEDVRLEDSYDLIFTSPPYFDIEKYSQEDTQSYIRYPTYESWKNNFLKVLIEKSKTLLKKDGYFALNVGGILIDDTRSIGDEVFGTQPEIYYMRLSKFLGQGNKNSVSHKLEPIFIWKKNK